MTNEQRESIETMQHWIEYEKKHKDEINKADELIHIQDTVLSLIKEQEEEMQQKDKQIDLMVEYIDKIDVSEDICEGKTMCDENCKDCIKQYFAGLVEKENDKL